MGSPLSATRAVAMFSRHSFLTENRQDIEKFISRCIFKKKIEELKNNAIIDLAMGSNINLSIPQLECDEEVKSDKIIPCKRSPDEQISNETLRVS